MLNAKGHNRYILNIDTKVLQSILLNSWCCFTGLSQYLTENTPCL